MNTESYNKAVKEFSDDIFRFILKQLKSSDDSADIVQDAFEKLWKNRMEVEFHFAKKWLFKTSYRMMIDFLRKQKVRNSYVNHSDTFLENHDFELKQTLDIAFQTLNEIQKTVLILRDYEGYDYQTIGDITGLSESNVKINIYRARIQMKKFLVNITLHL